MEDVCKIKIRKRLENVNNLCQCSMVVYPVSQVTGYWILDTGQILDFIDQDIDIKHCKLIQVSSDSLDMTLLEESLNPPSVTYYRKG